jgi:hypothetical protein
MPKVIHYVPDREICGKIHNQVAKRVDEIKPPGGQVIRSFRIQEFSKPAVAYCNQVLMMFVEKHCIGRCGTVQEYPFYAMKSSLARALFSQLSY